MREANERLFDEAIAVMNRALEGGASAKQLFPGATEKREISVAVLGSNPDEDQGVTLRLRGRAFEVVDRFDPHQRTPATSFSIRLDDVKRIISDPDHYASAPTEVAQLVTAS